MIAVFSFWLVIQLLSICALPLAWRLFGALPDRGYAFAKPLGLMLVSYVLWLGGSFGFLNNDLGGILVGLLAVIALSFWWGRDALKVQDGERPLFAWLRGSRHYIIVVEVLFLVTLAGWAIVRAYNPHLDHTEKPMELAFLNGILQSPRFPPIDPWLSGFSISYYYFGYVMLAALVRAAGVASAVGFNVGAALWFALVAIGSYGLAYNLMALAAAHRRRILAFALLGPLLTVGIGNLEGVVEFTHARQIGSDDFYHWLDVHNLNIAPPSDTWYPQDNWWWWRASRVINDRDLTGAHVEVISEFPFFSFLLGDMHPHVLALPFVLLAIALSLHLLAASPLPSLGNGAVTGGLAEKENGKAWSPTLEQRIRRTWRDFAIATGLGSGGIVFYALLLGGLSFLNTWDFPIYLVMLLAAYGIRRAQEQGGWYASLGWDVVVMGLTLGIAGLALYLPFYLGFSSQASGVLPNLLFPTKLRQFGLMFGVFAVPLAGLLVWATDNGSTTPETANRAVRLFVIVILLPVLLTAIMLVLYVTLNSQRAFVESVLNNPVVQQNIGGRSIPGLLVYVLGLRITTPFVYLVLAAGIAWAMALLWQRLKSGVEATDAPDHATTFALLMAGIAFLLTFAVEFIYLRDGFGTRMNTVFKFYYQAWVLMALASAYALFRLAAAPKVYASVAVTVSTLVIVLALYYPVAATVSRSNGFQGEPTLDGLAYFRAFNPDEAAAIEWLRRNAPPGSVVLEAKGDSYRANTSRVSTQTGLPTLLGWGGHELQWRGNYQEPGRREPVIDKIYTSPDALERQRLLQEFGVDYVFVGAVEIDRYRLNDIALNRLAGSMDLVFESGAVRIFQTREATR